MPRVFGTFVQLWDKNNKLKNSLQHNHKIYTKRHKQKEEKKHVYIKEQTQNYCNDND